MPDKMQRKFRISSTVFFLFIVIIIIICLLGLSRCQQLVHSETDGGTRQIQYTVLQGDTILKGIAQAFPCYRHNRDRREASPLEYLCGGKLPFFEYDAARCGLETEVSNHIQRRTICSARTIFSFVFQYSSSNRGGSLLTGITTASGVWSVVHVDVQFGFTF